MNCSVSSSSIPPAAVRGPAREAGDARQFAERPAEAAWYCLKARNKREHFAALQLTERTGIEAFAPRLNFRRPRRDGAMAVATEALFPGYLFARFDLAGDSRFVSSTPDITGLVHFGNHTPAVPESLIELLRRHANSATSPIPTLAEGDWIEVLAGCLAGNEGKLVAFDSGHTRAWILLDFLGRDLRVSLPVGHLRRTGPVLCDFPPQLLASCS